jgi:excisionase family DNA binding protein
MPPSLPGEPGDSARHLAAVPGPRWASLHEAADYAGVHYSTMRRWVAAGRPPGSRLGPRKIQVDLNDLDRMRCPVTTTTTK